jgi:hypothetical protein
MDKKQTDISQHILPVAATMVGVCMTVITVMQIAPKSRLTSLADDCLAIDSLLFLVSTLLSYWTIRPAQSNQKLELWADRFFLLGMIFMVVISFLVAFELFID